MTKRRTLWIWLILLVLLLAGLFIDLNAGYSQISLTEMIDALFGSDGAGVRFTLMELRMPRVLCSLLVGIGLSVSGCLLQGITRNDMADPGVLGINAGAGFAIALWIVLVVHASVSFSLMLPLLAFAGSAVTALAEFFLARKRGVLKPGRMLLIGVALSMGLGAATSMLMLRMSDGEYNFVQSWIAGSLWGANWDNVLLLTVGMVLLTGFALYRSRLLNLLVLGEESYVSLGVSPRQPAIMLLAAIALSSLCCAVGGGLSFIGLVCPHMARRLTGPRYQSLLITSLLCGGVLMVYADIISRSWFLPYEMPVGIVTAVIGAPYFLYLLVRKKA